MSHETVVLSDGETVVIPREEFRDLLRQAAHEGAREALALAVSQKPCRQPERSSGERRRSACTTTMPPPICAICAVFSTPIAPPGGRSGRPWSR